MTSNMDKFLRVEDFEYQASKIFDPSVADYYAHGAGAGTTVQLNREAYKRIRIRPRMLRNVSKRDISTTILGEKVSMPVGVSPTGEQMCAHPDGECANVKAVETAGTIFILSSYSNVTIQKVARTAPNAIKWLQISVMKDREGSIHFVRQAEQAGFKAIVLTIDNPILTSSKRRKRENNSLSLAIYEDYFSSKNQDECLKNTRTRARELFDDSLTWEAVTWLKSTTKLPIVLKGILTPEDALLAVKYGASGIIVSNQGGRQIDGAIATIEALLPIVEAVGDEIEVYVDGGVRSGTDVFKALALGAKMVFVGRPMLWGLACGGTNGALAVLEIFRRDIDETFALSGCSYVKDVTKSMIVHESLVNRL